jgi:hypothetical protein
MKKRLSLALILLAFPSMALAGVAPFWEWKSSTGAIVCAQSTPGKGWVKWTGPYSDLRCSVKQTDKKYRLKQTAPAPAGAGSQD